MCLAAGLDGIEKGMTPPEEITENIYLMNAQERETRGILNLPGSLDEALVEMQKDPVVMDALGPHVAAAFLECKQAECEEYRTRVSSWEREKYLIAY